ncbi:MAG: hypothetical protein RLZZ324_603 [Candidatus Parcubacteria bacterium]|jgi:diacylglycerol kinase family enzyme
MAKNPKIVAIENPHAGKNTPRQGLGLMVAGVLTSRKRTFSTRTIAELDQAIDKIRNERPDIVMVSGGDGTLKTTLSALRQSYDREPEPNQPRVIIVPMGTMNVVASTLGISAANPEAFAKRIAAKVTAGIALDTSHLSMLRFSDTYGFLYGSGMPVNLLEEYYKSEQRGSPRVLQVVWQAFLQELKAKLLFRKSPHALTRPVHARIQLPRGHEPPVSPYMAHTAIMVGTVEQVGMGCPALHDARTYPGKFMLRSTQLGFFGLARHVGHFWAGIPSSDVFDACVDHLVVEYESPTTVTIDGEMLPGRTRDIITCGPMVEFITG